MAARFWVGGGSAGNWNSTGNTNWSATSGGAGNQSVPGSSDDVTFDGAGASGNSNCTVTGANASALTLTFTSGYTATITIDTNRIITLAGSFTDRPEHTWTVTSVQAGALTINAAATITSNAKTFPGNVSLQGNVTRTLADNWTITGALTCVSATTTINGNTLSCAGLTVSQTTTGTTVISLSGGTWSGANNISNSITLAGNVTISGQVQFLTGTLTYSSGTITTTSSTLQLNGGCTLNTNGVTWNTITIGAAGTYTINSLLTATLITITDGFAVTFAGTAGFTTATLTISATTARTMTFANTVTYTITAALNAFASRTASILLFTSDHASNKAIITLSAGATCSVLADATRIDSSNGRTINTFHGTLTTTTNWFSYTDYGGGIASSYVWC